MTKTINVILLVSISVLVSGCVATQGDMGSIYERQNRLEATIDRLSSEIQAVKISQEETAGIDVELREKVFQIENQVQELNSSYEDLRRKTDNFRYNPPPSLSIGEVPPPSAEEPSENSVYAEAEGALSDGRYEEARERFRLFLSKYPDSSKAADATYGIAESFYREKEFEGAILAYQRFIGFYPDDQRVPLCYLKQGSSLIEMGRKEEGKLFLEILIDKYPESEEAKTAKENIKELAIQS